MDHWVTDFAAWLHTRLSPPTLGPALADASRLAAANGLVFFDPQLCMAYCPEGSKLKAPLPESSGGVRVIGDSEGSGELQGKLNEVFANPPAKLRSLLELNTQATALGRDELSPEETEKFLGDFMKMLSERSEPKS